MKIFVTGTRGIPDIPGGVEKHCQELYPRIAALGHEITVVTRTPYVSDKMCKWQGVRLCHLFAPRMKSIEAIVHTFLAVLKASITNPDILHIHAIGPSLMVPLARLLGLKVVVTHHGSDYDRKKWGTLAKIMLRLGEFVGGKYASEVIVISKGIEDIIQKRCKRSSHLIYNGARVPEKEWHNDYLESIGVVPGNYIFTAARFVPEKGLHDLIEAFIKIPGDTQLVIAGDADHETEYSRGLKQKAAHDKRIVLTGYITGEILNQAFTNTRLFVLPSYHEGLPIALLEAMSYGLPILVSDIQANKEVNLPPERFFRCGDVQNLKDKIELLLQQGVSDTEREDYRSMILEKYNWQKIAEQTISVYQKAIA